MFQNFLEVPPKRRLMLTAGIAAATTMLTLGLLFYWFDLLMALGSRLGALEAINDAAARLEAKGDLGEAESLLRSSLVIQERRATREPFGLGAEIVFETQSQLAFVLLKRGREAEAATLHRQATEAAQHRLGSDPYDLYERAWLTTRYGELLARLGQRTRARAQFEAARMLYRQAWDDADAYLRAYLEDGMETNEARRLQLDRSGGGSD